MWRVTLVCCTVVVLNVSSLPVLKMSQRDASGPSARNKTSVGKVPFRHPYIKQLYEKITYENGTIIKGNIGNDPITIWSFLDVDLVQEKRYPTHAAVSTPKGAQVLINVFNWNSLKEDSFDSKFDLSKVIIRLYKDRNYTSECSKATLQAKVYCNHDSGDSEFTGIAHPVNLSNGRYWEELDLTDQFKSLWPIPDGGKVVYVTITLTSQCANKNLPIKLYNLKTISKLKTRRKLYSNQPVLCLYLNDDMIEKLVRTGPEPAKPIPSDEVLPMRDNMRKAHKQNTKRDESNSCRKVDHFVDIQELGLHYVLLPAQFNAGRCVGSCGYNNLPSAGEIHKVNNYAKMLAAQGDRRKDPNLSICCSPGEYDPLMLLIATSDGSSIKQKMYHEMRVRECYCR